MTSEAELESVILLRTTDPVRARMIRALLEQEDVPVATPGLEHHSLMPHVGAALEIVVRVPKRDLDRARALVREMEREVEEEPVPSETAPYREAATKKPAPLAPRLRRVTVVAAFICPGGAHFYVQRYVGGGLVIAGYAAAIAAMIAEVPLSGYLLAVPWLADVLGGFEGCAVARGEAGSPARRQAPLGALALVGVWSMLALGPLLGTLAGSDAVTMCEYEARCDHFRTERACLLHAANQGTPPREPACLACIRRERECAAVEASCEEACWPNRGEPTLFGLDPVFFQ